MYQLTENSSSVRRMSDGAVIPNDLCNTDYRDFMAWVAAGNIPIPAPEPTADEIREKAKSVRAEHVAAITVTTSAGNTFDGDEISQGRMACAIIALQSTGTPNVNWVLADNTVIQAAAAELTEALALAGAAQAAIWVI